MKAGKARTRFLANVVAGVAFLMEIVSGFVLWLVLPRGGFQGGRNLYYESTFIVSRDTWLTLHDWFALLMVIAIAAHLVQHWRWILYMFRKLWRDACPGQQNSLAARAGESAS